MVVKVEGVTDRTEGQHKTPYKTQKIRIADATGDIAVHAIVQHAKVHAIVQHAKDMPVAQYFGPDDENKTTISIGGTLMEFKGVKYIHRAKVLGREIQQGHIPPQTTGYPPQTTAPTGYTNTQPAPPQQTQSPPGIANAYEAREKEKVLSIHRQCASKVAVEMVKLDASKGAITSGSLFQVLLDYSDRLVSYYEKGQPPEDFFGTEPPVSQEDVDAALAQTDNDPLPF
jgi:hypothetical protein